MAFQTVFKRYELKYLLTEEQKENILLKIRDYMTPDQYGTTTIRNIYFATDNYRLVRRSIEKPACKEKLRIRSYSMANPDSTVFVELKKKYRKVVYKRRVALPEHEAVEWLTGVRHCRQESQISEEVDYFIQHYGELSPKVFLSYEREAFYAKDDANFRVTFDENILCRQQELSLEAEVYGEPVLPEGITLMEIKCSGGIPIWMAHALSGERIYRTSFSKYGTAYKFMIYPELRKAVAYNA